jgi:MFS superfamily sulfate permease-like transporter
MTSSNQFSLNRIFSDMTASFVVFLVALPLCLGVCVASEAPIFSGILAGVIGGIIVGSISGSSTSVSGPAAGLIAVVAAQIKLLGSFEAFLTAVLIAGIIQVVFGISKMGFISSFFPSSVIKGLLWAIGFILITKQLSLVFGHEANPLSNDAFVQASEQNSFSQILETDFKIHPGTALVGLISLFLLIIWDKISFLKNSLIPAPVVVIALSILLTYLLQGQDEYWALHSKHFVHVPLTSSLSNSINHLKFPDFSILNNSAVYIAAITIAIIASLETLLNIDALDKIDPLQRVSPPNRELVAQGIGNIFAGLLGALPITSVIVRSSVNITMGAKTKLSTICHGFFILNSVLFFPNWLNMIPLSALAAILVITGLKLASPKVVIQMWQQGKNQLLPFLATVIAIVMTDLLIGVLIGLGVATYFILNSNIKSPIKMTLEKHSTGDQVSHIVLPNQVSFFNRASLERLLKNVAQGGHVLIDARNTDYIDPDILTLISDFENKKGKVKQITTSFLGFKDKYARFEDHIEYVEVNNKEIQASLTPSRVLELLQEGNLRFRKDAHLTRNLSRQLDVTSVGQFPMAVVLSCIDSRSPVELIFDLSLGDIFSVRIAGNVVSPKILGSIEYSCAVAGAKLILVMGHTSCGAIKASVDFACNDKSASEVTGCMNLDSLIEEIQQSIDPSECINSKQWSVSKKEEYCNEVGYKNVVRSMQEIRKNSTTLNNLINEGKIAIVGAMYDINTAEVSILQVSGCSPLAPIKPNQESFISKIINKKSLWGSIKEVNDISKH